MRKWLFILVISLVGYTSWGAVSNIDELKKLAESGDANAQCLMGVMSYSGGTIYDPRLIETQTLESLLLTKIPAWDDKVIENTDIDSEDTMRAGTLSNQSYEWFIKSAEQGNKYAYYCLGICYLRGIGVELDYTKAQENLIKSADLGYCEAQYRVAKKLLGSNQKTNIAKGLKYLSSAADTGHIDAEAYKGYCYLKGMGVEKNVEYGLKTIQDCYSSGSACAAVDLANIYIKGDLLPKNVNEGINILEKQCKIENNYCAKDNLADYLLIGADGIKKDVPRGMKLLKSAAKNSSAALDELGGIYVFGRYGFPINEEKAFFYYRQAAARENAHSCTEVGIWYMRGLKPLKKDLDKARYWLRRGNDLGDEEAGWYLLDEKRFEQAAEKGSARMQEALGWRSLLGVGCETNIPLSNRLYQMSADQGNSGAAYAFGRILTNPNSVEYKAYLDYEKGIKYLNLAAAKGELLAIHRLGSLYLNGCGVEKNLKKAVELYEEAADKGDMSSAGTLGKMYLYGENMKRDYAKAYKYLSRVEDASSIDDGNDLTGSITSLGVLYFYGLGCSMDRFRAVSLFSKAVSCGGQSSREGNYYMGLAYYNGYGVDRDVARAMSFLEKSAELKDTKAIKTLDLIKSGKAKVPLTEWDADPYSP
ncbi:MAG: SEL1-like repeat protein [Aliarcobacter sp.]